MFFIAGETREKKQISIPCQITPGVYGFEGLAGYFQNYFRRFSYFDSSLSAQIVGDQFMLGAPEKNSKFFKLFLMFSSSKYIFYFIFGEEVIFYLSMSIQVKDGNMSISESGLSSIENSSLRRLA